MLKEAEAIDPTDVPLPRVDAEEQAPAAKPQPEPAVELPASVAEILARMPPPQDEGADYLRQLAQISSAQEPKDEPAATEPTVESTAAAAPDEPPADEAPPAPDPLIDLPPSVAAILSRVPRP